MDSETAVPLNRIRLGDNPEDGKEFHLQSFIARNPLVLPIDQIERTFVGAIPVCMEMRTTSGLAIDNLLVTPKGDLILVECKLWRNPEARRKVVVQILEYAKEIAKFSYADLEAAIKSALIKSAPKDEAPKPSKTLYEFAKTSPDALEEPEFIDQVSKGLRRGRFLLLVVGDGIREDLEDLVEFVQQHAGLHFTLGLIDMAIFRAPSGGLYVQPRTIARTMNIDRGIVSVKDGIVNIESPAPPPGGPRSRTISEEKFYEDLTRTDPKLPAAVQSFFDRVVSDLGIEIDFGQASIVLRWRAVDVFWNLGFIDTSGELHTEALDIQAKRVGHRKLSDRYQEHLCALIPGAQITKGPVHRVVKASGQRIEAWDLLADDTRRDGWIAAIVEFMEDVNATDTTG